MKLLRKINAVLFDSPTFGRDRANLISGFTIGSAGLLLNGAIMCFVMPLLFDPDDEWFRQVTEGIGFGQTLALILLGGATILATLLIPLRLVSVFWGPRIGRYFDQIVLSGISPTRFVLGKALSQNLFLGLIVFLLLPYMVLCVTLGGLDLVSFFAGVFVLWLYCMALALITLWLSLYVNELVSAGIVIVVASFVCFLSALPIPFQPIWLTPFPLLMQPVYASSTDFMGGPGGPASYFPEFNTLFFGCTAGISVVICFALVGIYIGPLYGIIRDNSTFGEVVRPGDSKRKRWFRLRQHIQRPSEIAFFYENRSELSRRFDGLIRWGISFVGVAGLMLLVRGCVVAFLSFMFLTRGAPGGRTSDFAYAMHIFNLVVHGIALVLSIFFFSHSRNSLYQKSPFAFGKRFEVAKIDNWAFFLFVCLGTASAILMPQFLNQVLIGRMEFFPTYLETWRGDVTYMNFPRAHIEGTLVLSIAAVTIFILLRHLCQVAWLRTAAFFAAAGSYFAFAVLMPFLPAIIYSEFRELHRYEWMQEWFPKIAMSSPAAVLLHLFEERPPILRSTVNGDPITLTTIPFYIAHGAIVLLLLFMIRRTGGRLRGWYLQPLSEQKKSSSELSKALTEATA